MFASISWSVDPGLSVRRLVAFAFMIIAAMGTATIAFERLPIFITTFCSLNLAAGVLSEIVLGTFSIGTAGYRFGGTVHPNLQGVNLALLIIGCVWLVWQKMNKRNWATYGCLTAATIFLVLTGSRTTLGAVVLTFLFTLGIQGVRRRGFKSLGFAVPVATLLASVVLTLAISTPWISLRALTKDTIMMERDEGDLSLLTGRVAVWQTVLEYIGDRPILGYGHDAFWSADRIEEISRIRGWPVSHAHNGYIEMLANLGAVGLGLYMVVILLGTIQCSRQFLRGDDACGIASALMVFGLFHNLLESIMVLPLFSQFFILTALLNAGFLNRSVRIA
jgi:O-antigen ligase